MYYVSGCCFHDKSQQGRGSYIVRNTMNAISGSLLWGKFHYDYDMKGKGLTDRHTGKCKFFFVIKFVKLMHVSLRISCTAESNFQVNYVLSFKKSDYFTSFDIFQS